MTNFDLLADGTADRRHNRNGPNDKPPSIAARPGPSNSVAALKLLSRNRGATIAELTALTGWQPHSVRAHICGLRKKGIVLLREARKTGESAYRVANPGGGDSTIARGKDDPAVDAAGGADTADAAIAAGTVA